MESIKNIQELIIENIRSTSTALPVMLHLCGVVCLMTSVQKPVMLGDFPLQQSLLFMAISLLNVCRPDPTMSDVFRFSFLNLPLES